MSTYVPAALRRRVNERAGELERGVRWKCSSRERRAEAALDGGGEGLGFAELAELINLEQGGEFVAFGVAEGGGFAFGLQVAEALVLGGVEFAVGEGEEVGVAELADGGMAEMGEVAAAEPEQLQALGEDGGGVALGGGSETLRLFDQGFGELESDGDGHGWVRVVVKAILAS